MSGCPAVGATDQALSVVANGMVGSVILTGRSYRGLTSTAQLTTRLQQAAAQAGDTSRLMIATDQEGGEVQVLRGPGFDDIPSALEQGRRPTDTLRSDARRWGQQLRAAGVTLDLGPVLDTVPDARFAESNPPIGGYHREFGFTPAVVSAHGIAVLAGLRDSGVQSTIKHFPGLGRVTANTDDSANVTDDTTTAADPFIEPFKDAIDKGTTFVMMSSATYPRIDSRNIAAFSPILIRGLLRTKLHFQGVVISDDLGMAAQVGYVPVGQRATDFLTAGGDLVLTVLPAQIPVMTAAVTDRAAHDPAFGRRVDDAVRRVLAAKLAAGLLP